MSGRPTYEPMSPVMVRVPLMPIEFLELGIAPQDVPVGSVATVAESDVVARRDEWLRSALERPGVRESLEVASPTLAASLKRWTKDPLSDAAHRTRFTLSRYLTRMASRPTPFGQFAGVALAELGDHMTLQISGRDGLRTRTRIDMDWLIQIAGVAEERLPPGMSVRWNPAVYEIGDRNRVALLDSFGKQERQAKGSVRSTRLTDLVREIAFRAVTVSELVQRLSEETGADPRALTSLIGDLLAAGLLQSSLRPPLTGEDPAQHVRRELITAGGCDDLAAALVAALDLAARSDVLPIGERTALLRALRDHLASGPVKPAEEGVGVQVDMATKVSGTFSRQVAREIAVAARLLVAISAPEREYAHLRAYRRDFMKRYGEREVSLLELLDEDIGLGPPASYISPPRVYDATPPHERPDHQRERLLTRLAGSALRSGDREISLDASDVEGLQTQGWENAPRSLEVYAFLAAESATEIDAGNYDVIIGPRVAINGVGRSLGRFADLLGSRAEDALVSFAHLNSQARPDLQMVELVYMPLQPRMANVAVRPVTTGTEIAAGVAPGRGIKHEVRLSELRIGVDGDRFYVVSPSLNQRIIVSTTHLLNEYPAPNACRFLAEVAAEEELRAGSFDWGPLTDLPALPRLRVGKVILSPARWSLRFSDLPGDACDTPERFAAFIAEWRGVWDPPRYVLMSEQDVRLLINLDDPLSLEDLRREVLKRKDEAVELFEMVPDEQSIWTEGPDGHYLAEFVVPLKIAGSSPVGDRPRQTESASMAPHVNAIYPPGSEWLYLKFYMPSDSENRFITGPMAERVGALYAADLITSWFFLRYRDPLPHIRLRMHGDPRVLAEEVLPRILLDHALSPPGMHHPVLRLAVDTYEPETDRYGGPDALPLIERIFWADSVFVTETLSLIRDGTIETAPEHLGLISMDDLFESLGMDLSTRLRLCRHASRESPAARNRHQAFGEQYRSTRKQLEATFLTRNSGDRSSSLELHRSQRRSAIEQAAAQLRAVLTRSAMSGAATEIAIALAHMHHNRLLGVDPVSEAQIYYKLGRLLATSQNMTGAEAEEAK